MPDLVHANPSEDNLAKQAEIMALRQIGDILKTVSQEMAAQRKDMSEVKVDIAVMKERQSQNQELRETVKALEGKIEVLEARNLREDGAVTFLTFLKDFGPWLAALLVFAWSLFGKK